MTTPTSPQEDDDNDRQLREASERSFRLSMEQYANVVSVEYDLPFEQVVQIMIAHGEALATVEGMPVPEERRYFPAGSLPHHPPKSRKAAVPRSTQRLVHDAVNTQMVGAGIDPHVVDSVLAELGKTLRSDRRVRRVRRALWMVPLGILLLLLVVGIIADMVEEQDDTASEGPEVHGIQSYLVDGDAALGLHDGRPFSHDATV